MSRANDLRRRCWTIPVYLTAAAAVWAGLPLLATIALVVDVVRPRRWVMIRLSMMSAVYLAVETLGILAITVTAVFPSELKIRATYAIQRMWAEALYQALRRLFSLRLVVRDEENLAESPFLLVSRHTSIVDTLIPAHLVTRLHGIKLRYVLKRELLVDPCLDLAGSRLPNRFVDRAARSDQASLVAELAADLQRGEAVLIYPEGTRFTPEKQRRHLERLARHNPGMYRLARDLRWVMPPRPGGVLAALEANPLDVVTLTHTGLEGLATVADLFDGRLVGRTIEVELWRTPHSEIPGDRAARVEWLFGLWSRVDGWVGERVAR